MKFTPAKNVDHPIKEGKVDFVVESLEGSESKSGHPLIVISMKVTDKDGVSKTLFERFSINNEKSIWALGLFAKAAGVYEQYQQGELTAEDVTGKSGQCDVAYEEYEDAQGDTKKALRVKKYHF